MIPYIEVRENKYPFKKISLIEPQECWFELSYQNVGEFEIFCRASKENIEALKKGRFITIPHKRFLWVITAIKYTFTAGGAKMISATGYEAKWILGKRIILKPKELQGNITNAIYGLVNSNLGIYADPSRKIFGLNVDTNNLLIDVSGTQAPRGNLLNYIIDLVKVYGCGFELVLDNEFLKFTVYTGIVKTDRVKFSQSLDNLLFSDYLTDDSELANYALVVSTIDNVDYTGGINKGAQGIDRAEILINSNISNKYEDANGEEKEIDPTSQTYKGWLDKEAANEITKYTTVEEINGELDITNSNYEFDKDFYIGDLVRMQDEYFNFHANTRITKYTFKQDAKGYGEEAEYGGEE